MKRRSKLLAIAILSGLFLNSCSSDDDAINEPEKEQPEGTFTNGFFVLNEGSFGNNNSTVTYVSNDFSTNEIEIFLKANDESLGDTGQSITFDDDYAYIIANASNLINVVNRYTFELVGQIDSGLVSPRYAVVENDKMYVTNQGSYEDSEATAFDDFVAVINLETLEVEKTIETNTLLEYIHEENGMIYVQNAAFGSGNGITVIDSTIDEIIDTIETEDNLISFEIEDGVLYALSSAILEKIDLITGEVISEIVIEQGSASNLQIEDEMIYYTIGTKVYRLGLNDETAPEAPVLEYSSNSTYGGMYGFEVEGDYIYTAEAPTFTENGTIRIYDLNGDLTTEFDSGGIGPNGFYFND
jgi:hypothetical protein